MRRAPAVVCLAAMLLPAGCAAASPAPAVGTVTGRLVLEGGPLGAIGQQPGTRPVPGTVQFIGVHHQRILVRLNSSGRFTVQLPAGRYWVSDRSPRVLQVGPGGAGRQTWSRPALVTVTPHHTTKITLAIIVP
jgi:hypothetical protein